MILISPGRWTGGSSPLGDPWLNGSSGNTIHGHGRKKLRHETGKGRDAGGSRRTMYGLSFASYISCLILENALCRPGRNHRRGRKCKWHTKKSVPARSRPRRLHANNKTEKNREVLPPVMARFRRSRRIFAASSRPDLSFFCHPWYQWYTDFFFCQVSFSHRSRIAGKKQKEYPGQMTTPDMQPVCIQEIYSRP
jgi:hypothetical protein